MPEQALVAALLSATLLLAGCGGSRGAEERLTHDEYLQHLRQIEAGTAARSADRLFFKLVLDDPVLPRQSCLAQAREFARNVNNIVDEVASLAPPQAVQSLQDRFVSAARETAGVVDEAVDDVRDGKLGCGQPMNRRIYGLPSTQRVEEVLMELGRRGYRLGSNSD